MASTLQQPLKRHIEGLAALRGVSEQELINGIMTQFVAEQLELVRELLGDSVGANGQPERTRRKAGRKGIDRKACDKILTYRKAHPDVTLRATAARFDMSKATLRRILDRKHPAQKRRNARR
jgi:hypothetical protein